MEITYEKRTSVFKDWNDIEDGEVFLVEGEPWLAYGGYRAINLKTSNTGSFANGQQCEVVDAIITIYRN